MKRVLQVIATLRIGGAEKVARDLGLYADPTKYEIHYIVFGNEIGDYEHELIESGCQVYHWPSPAKSYLQYFVSLKALLQENHYDVVHAHTMFNIGWSMLVARLCGVPTRIAHAHSALDNGVGLKKQVYEKIMRQMIVYNATDLVACGSAAGIRLYGEKVYSKRGKCILNGIDTTRYIYCEKNRRLIRKELSLGDSFVIGHVGHLMKVKNQRFLIQLMPELMKRKPNAKLLMLGEGPERQNLEQMIQDLRLSEHIIMTGNVRNVQDYLSAMDVFAFPSLYEGMPLSIIEVQANGLPCILSNGVPEDAFLTDLVQTIPLNQPQQWVDAICAAKRLVPEQYADELKQKGFDISAVMDKFFQIYAKEEKTR